MSIIDKQELLNLSATSKGKLLGLDIGTKTVGIALSDLTRSIASPYLSHERKGWKRDLPVLEKIIADNQVYAIVAGLPLNMDGSEGPRCDYVRKFMAHVIDAIPLPVCFWDERLSTLAVERMMIEADMSRKRRSEIVDKLAASYILQGALDWLRNHR